jgi:hypothetical protein
MVCSRFLGVVGALALMSFSSNFAQALLLTANPVGFKPLPPSFVFHPIPMPTPIKLPPCFGLTALQCSTACGNTLNTMTTNYNNSVSSCVTSDTNSFNATTTSNLSSVCKGYGFNDVDSCLNGITGAIQTACQNAASPSQAQITAQTATCTAAAATLSQVCSTARTTQSTLQTQQAADQAAVTADWAKLVTDSKALAADNAAITANNKTISANQCPSTLRFVPIFIAPPTLPVIPAVQ